MTDYACTAVAEPLSIPRWLGFRALDDNQAPRSAREWSVWRHLRRLRPARARRTSGPTHAIPSGPAYSPSQHRGHQMLLLDDRTVIGDPMGRACAGGRSV
ncbi:MAG: hypothetical protein Q7V58_12825 [Actinomycetota bacterium]|nr:hypothetical protein [Actinomycetota bacterium]